MEQYINKSAVIAEIEKLKSNLIYGACASQIAMETRCKEEAYNEILSYLNSLEVKEVDLEKESLTWEDIRELYIIFAEVNVDIELCKTANIQTETIGYYQEVLKRFKAQKGE